MIMKNQMDAYVCLPLLEHYLYVCPPKILNLSQDKVFSFRTLPFYVLWAQVGCECNLGFHPSTWQPAELSWWGWQIVYIEEHLQVTFFLEQVGSWNWGRGWKFLSHNFFPKLLWRCCNYLLSQTWAIEHRINLALNKEEIMSLRKIVPFHEPIFSYEDIAHPQNFCKQHRRQMYIICDERKWLNCLLGKKLDFLMIHYFKNCLLS